MPALAPQVLFGKLKAALPVGTTFETPANVIHPAICTAPGFGRLRIYLFTVTPDRSTPGARPPGEFKIQLIIEGQPRAARGSLDLSGATTALLGYSPDYGVFVGWQAHLYTAFAYSANVQVREPLLEEARRSGWAVAEPRKLRQTSEEVRVAFAAGNLMSYLRASREADRKALEGRWREAYLLSKVPNFDAAALPRRSADLAAFVQRERRRLAATRLSRDSRFAPRVKEQFNYSCALCNVQLEIVEAAHIIPVNDEKSRDEVWNGLALCPSHHTLFDARRFLVTPDLAVAIDGDAVSFLQESGRASGIELLTNYTGKRIQAPVFWDTAPAMRNRMRDALSHIQTLAAIG
jgi:putative restriction endonuclease